mgnify:CR=1 FL=1
MVNPFISRKETFLQVIGPCLRAKARQASLVDFERRCLSREA